MQLIWVSGPTAKVVTLSITLKKVLLGLGVMALFFTLLGVVFHFVGLRIAVEYSPALVHSIGGVTSRSELERVEAGYQSRLTQLQQRVQQMLDTVHELEQQKTKMADLIGWDAGRQRLQQGLFGLRHGQGGPLNSLPWLNFRSQTLSTQLQQTDKDFEALEQWLREVDQQWERTHQRLLHLPTSLPVREPFGVTSGFGVRLDPFSRFPSLHEGIDFVADPGTPIQVTAPGVVRRSEYFGAYGQMVEVEHAEGFSSRYAHLRERRVQPGQSVERGEVIGTLGNTGRSTGPHLHYEILRHGRALHPARAFESLGRS